MQVEIVEIAPMRLHSVLHRGPVSQIPQAWRRLEAWLSPRVFGGRAAAGVLICCSQPIRKALPAPPAARNTLPAKGRDALPCRRAHSATRR